MTKRAATKKIPESAKRWAKRAVAFVVALGSVAAAITAIAALWPEPEIPDPRDSADLSVRVISPVRLSDYAQRLSDAGPQGFHQAQPTVTPTETSTEPSDDPTDVSSTSDRPTSSPTSASASVAAETGLRVDPNTVDETVDEVIDRLQYCKRHPVKCAKATAQMRLIAAGNTTDVNGNKVEPEVAAQRVLEILKDSRKTAEQEPIGAIVTVDAVLVGLRARPVLLTWAMWHAGGQRLHAGWFNDHLAYQLLASTDHDSATVHLWVPLPTMPGPFLVDVEARLDGAGLASERSEEFE